MKLDTATIILVASGICTPREVNVLVNVGTTNISIRTTTRDSEREPDSSTALAIATNNSENTFGYLAKASWNEEPPFIDSESPTVTLFRFLLFDCRSITDSALESDRPALSIVERFFAMWIISGRFTPVPKVMKSHAGIINPPPP